MEFLVLGPLEVWRDGQPIEVRGSKRRALLALLIVHANEVVRSDRLVDALWGERSPGNASAALQNHISRLRKDLGGDILITKPWGYVIRADPQSIDLQRFEALLAESRTLPAHQRRERMQEALALWRGPALADVASEPALVTEVARLEELRLSALEQRIDADLELGGDPELVAEIEALVAQHPLRERLRGQLILALYRGGRQAEALEAYRETRRLLVEELGIEPSRELRELEQAILRQDPALGVAPAPHAPPAPDDDRRFRWPKSPLVIAAGALLLAGGGLASAVVLTAGVPAPNSAAPATSHESSPGTEERPSTSTAARTQEQLRPSTAARTQQEQPTTSTVAPARRKRQPSPPAATTAKSDPPTQTPARRSRPPQRPVTRPRQVVTTATKTTTGAKPRTTKPPPTKSEEPFTIADDFSRPVFDPAIWHIVGRDFGGAFDQSNGRLEITLLADAQPDPAWDQVGGHYGTRCQFPGDFDASAEFELITWPSGAGAYAGLSAFFADSAVVRQSSAQWGDRYASWVNGAHGGIPLEDKQGKLRLRRVGAMITTYIWYGGGWRTVVSNRSTGRATLGLQLQADGDEFSHTDVRVAFDNFVVSATEADCPPGSDPP